MSKVPMTVRGHQMMEEELKRLKYQDRPNVVQAVHSPTAAQKQIPT